MVVSVIRSNNPSKLARSVLNRAAWMGLNMCASFTHPSQAVLGATSTLPKRGW
jgi:hypothetical protein